MVLIRNIYQFLSKREHILLKDFTENIFKNPSKTILSSYFIFILIGGLLLVLPLSTNDENIRLIDAIFTSASALCVTGLTVFDTNTSFTGFGELVIILLIQVGGLGIMIFSSFFSFLFYKRISIEDSKTLSYLLNEENMRNIKKSIKKIIISTFIIEFIGVVFLFIGFSGNLGFSFKNLYYSIFHSISAFCNAGFSLFSNGLADYQNNAIIVFGIGILIILGGISFPVISNLFDTFQDRMKQQKMKKISENSKIVIIVTIILIISGTYLFYFLEHRNSLLKLNIFSQYMNAFFQSVTLRTAGFNTIDISIVTRETLIFMMVFMFIGGASGSTAGGIKINTFTVIIYNFKAFFRNNRKTIIMNKIIDSTISRKCFIIFIMSSMIVFISSFLLSLLNKDIPVIKLVFEIFSAFGTVGLSTGITSSLTDLSKIIIILLMFIGKIGPLTLFSSIVLEGENVEIEYPKLEVLIG